LKNLFSLRDNIPTITRVNYVDTPVTFSQYAMTKLWIENYSKYAYPSRNVPVGPMLETADAHPHASVCQDRTGEHKPAGQS